MERLQNKTRTAWLHATLKNPELKKQYGDDGWEVFKSVYGNMTQENVGRLFDRTISNAQLWHKEYRELMKQGATNGR